MRQAIKIFNNLLLIAAVLLTTACNAGDDMILEHKDVQLKVTEVPDRTPLVLKISGLAFHSALAVEKITTKTEESSLIVYVQLTIARPGLSGRFEHELSVPDSVNEVRFGKERFVIWKRKTTP